MSSEYARKSTMQNKNILDAFYYAQSIQQKNSNLKLPIPEVVIYGKQSEGKSTIIEGLIGFRFNTIQTKHLGLGTKSPIYIYSKYNPSFDEPRLYLTLPGSSKESVKTPEDLCRKLTSFYNQLGKSIIKEKVEIHIEYKGAANISLIDLPGLIEREMRGFEKSAKRKIKEITRNEIKKKERIILCVENAILDYENHNSTKFLKEVDPKFSRTVMIFSKVDMRSKMKGERLNMFLNGGENNGEVCVGDGLYINDVTRFYISLPNKAQINELEDEGTKVNFEVFQELIEKNEKRVTNLLKSNGMDERFESIVGFSKFRNYISATLYKKYEESIVPIQKKIQDIINVKNTRMREIEDLMKHNSELETRKKANETVRTISLAFSNLITGNSSLRFDVFGQTLEEEIKTSRIEWPEEIKVNTEGCLPSYSEMKVFGGSQLDRLFNEIEIQIRSIQNITTDIQEYVVKLGWRSGKTKVPMEQLPNEVAQSIFPALCEVILEVGEKRVLHLLRRLFFHMLREIENMELALELTPDFVKMMKNLYDEFIKKIAKDWRDECTFLAHQCASNKFSKVDNPAPIHERIEMTTNRQLLINEMGSRMDLKKGEYKRKKTNFDENELRGFEKVDKHDNYAILEKAKRACLFEMRDQMADLMRYLNYSKIIRPITESLGTQIQNYVITLEKGRLFKTFGLDPLNLDKEYKILQNDISDLTKVRSRFNVLQHSGNDNEQNESLFVME